MSDCQDLFSNVSQCILQLSDNTSMSAADFFICYSLTHHVQFEILLGESVWAGFLLGTLDGVAFGEPSPNLFFCRISIDPQMKYFLCVGLDLPLFIHHRSGERDVAARPFFIIMRMQYPSS